MTPTKTGFTFSPASFSFTNVLANQVQNFTPTAITYTISGALGATGAGATLAYTDGTAKTATADGSGNYTFTVSYDWTGTVTPTKTGFTFSPASFSFTNVLANQVQNFTPTAITYTISGALGAPGAGATLAYTDGTPKTATADGSGNYSFTVSYNWSGTVTPSAVTGFTLSPANRSFSNVLTDQTAQNFTYTAITFTISGYAGVSGGSIAYTDGTAKTAAIDGFGNYTFTVSYNWTGTVTPTLAGYTFFPASKSYANVLSDQLTQNFVAELNPISKISPVSWTLPAAPYATVGKTYAASVPTQAGYTIAWTIDSGTGTINGAANTEALSFTPTAVGTLVLKCVVTKALLPTSTGFYSVAVESVLTASPATITAGQGAILVPTFTGTGLINPGAIPVTSGTGLTVTPGTTTAYTLNVDGSDVATTTVTVKTFAPKFVYVANYNGGLSGFNLNTGDGALTEVTGSPYTGYTVERVTTDPSGKFLFAAGRNNGVYVYTIDATPGPTLGALTHVTGSPFVTEPALLTTSVAVDPSGRFVYVNSDIGKIYAFTLDAGTGALTSVPGSPFTASNNYNGELLVHPSGKFLFAACSNTDVVEAFVIDPASGALSPVAGSPFNTGVSVIGLSVDTTTKLIAGPSGLSLDPTGTYLIVRGDSLPNELAAVNKVAAFSVNPATGTLTPVTNSPFSLGILSSHVRHGLTYHPTKNVVFSTFFNFGTGDQSKDAVAFVLNGGAGTLTPTAESPYNFLTLYGSDCLAIDRSGQFAFAAIRDAGLIRRMRVDGTGVLKALDGTTAIAPIAPGAPETTAVGANPSSIVVAGSLL
ncbi:MAG: beta-propeller fold lactonase family protein [Holophagaceae bacterium]|uniref:Beta-propeller fold lactonase family protein n=1 Tax=Candidatus Geothrix skivensis TaxID=2954439 RepID=A0A9D7SJ52_9BACT|nr:beta-propeller fold lactonase family protein [Candidatus Geothrix skivensis]